MLIMIWEIITNYGDPIVLPILATLVLVGIVGLICSKSHRLFFIWFLKTIIKVNFTSCGLLMCYLTVKYSAFVRDAGFDGDQGVYLMFWFWSLMSCAYLYIGISLFAFIAVTIAELKQKYISQPEPSSYRFAQGDV